MRYPLYNQNGQLLANALQVHDITEQVHDEKNKSALLSSVSHDLRTPLTTIKAAITGLLQPDVEWDETTRQEILEEVDHETDRLSILINALVEMSRIEMGALVLEKELCDVVEIANSALARVDRVLAGQKVDIQVLSHPRQSLPLVQVDYVQLERVFYNLIENAARRTSLLGDEEQSPIIITLDVTDSDRDTEARKKLLRVQVIDHGPPVPESERERIFKSFYAQENATGGGLGLAICRGIIEAHQGQIWVESTSNASTCFAFTLPVHLIPSSSPEEFR
jgi:K+-sensing histidine kinase KdpD